MCETWTVHYACGCDFPAKRPSNGCNGNCTGNNIRYIDNDVVLQERCAECVARSQYPSPGTSSDSSASETSDE
jgi:hypothetical protein